MSSMGRGDVRRSQKLGKLSAMGKNAVVGANRPTWIARLAPSSVCWRALNKALESARWNPLACGYVP